VDGKKADPIKKSTAEYSGFGTESAAENNTPFERRCWLTTGC
jgi:hypothetical protein